MPFVRMTLAKGRDATFKRQLSLSVHQALQQAFNIPEDDFFQVIEELEPERLLYPDSYMGIPHSDALIYIQVSAKSGRTTEMKQQLYLAIAEQIEQRTGHSRDDIVIILLENDPANWSFGRGLAQLVA